VLPAGQVAGASEAAGMKMAGPGFAPSLDSWDGSGAGYLQWQDLAAHWHPDFIFA
jgi:hypothetical protein